MAFFQRFTHKNIPKIHSISEQEESILYSMDFCDGVDIASANINSSHLKQLVDLIHFFIENNIMHQDLASRNLLFTRNQVWLLDNESMNHIGVNPVPNLDKEYYAEDAVSKGSELYTLGILLCECILKKEFYANRQDKKLLLSLLLQKTTENFAKIVAHLLSQNINHRFGHKQSLLDELEGIPALSADN